MPEDLFEAIGGKDIVHAATELFYKKVFADPTLRPFFATTDIEQLKARQRMFLSMLLGGQAPYPGPGLDVVHSSSRREGLNDGHFDTFLRLFRDTLAEVGVDKHKATKILRLLEEKRSTVLNP